MTETIEVVFKDLVKRELRYIAFVCEDKNGDCVVLAYNKNGLVSYISEPCPMGVNIAERRGGHMFRDLIGFCKPGSEPKSEPVQQKILKKSRWWGVK